MSGVASTGQDTRSKAGNPEPFWRSQRVLADRRSVGRDDRCGRRAGRMTGRLVEGCRCVRSVGPDVPRAERSR